MLRCRSRECEPTAVPPIPLSHIEWDRVIPSKRKETPAQVCLQGDASERVFSPSVVTTWFQPPSLQFEDFITDVCGLQKRGRDSQSALWSLVWTVSYESKIFAAILNPLWFFFFFSWPWLLYDLWRLYMRWNLIFTTCCNILQYFKEKMRQWPFNLSIQCSLSTVGILMYCIDQLLLNYT